MKHLVEAPTRTEPLRAASDARLAAQRVRQRSGQACRERFEIFQEINRAGIWLMFQPLNKLYGLYQRIEDVAGIRARRTFRAQRPGDVRRNALATDRMRARGWTPAVSLRTGLARTFSHIAAGVAS